MQPIKNDVSDKSILTYTNPDKAGWWAVILAPPLPKIVHSSAFQSACRFVRCTR